MTIHLPRLPHVEPLQIGQQTEFGRKRCEVVDIDLQQQDFLIRPRSNRLNNRTQSSSSAVSCAISLGSEQSLLLLSQSSLKFFMRNNSDGSSVRPMSSS
jgi:hypothetical protein